MTSIIFRDILLSFLIGLVAITITLLSFVNPKAKEAEATQSPGNMSITAAWTEGHHDCDLWVMGPGEAKAIGYSNRAGKLFNLLRDDLGEAGDSMPLNYENAYSRGLPAGQYVINIHGYSIRDVAVQVSIEVRFGSPGASPKLAFEETLTLVQGQERTVIAFRLDDKGNIVPGSVNRVYVPLRSAGK